MVTDFLFVMPSFFHGFARTLDMWGSLNSYNQSATPAEADARAMYNDWAMVGEDLRLAIRSLETDLKLQEEQAETAVQ